MLPSPRQGSLPVGWLTFTEREFNPLDRVERFPILTSSSSSPVLFLALGGFSPGTSAGQELFVREPDGSRGVRLRGRLLHQPIQCKSSGYGDDYRHHTTDDERAHHEGPSTRRTSQAHHHSTTTTLPRLSVSIPVPARPEHWLPAGIIGFIFRFTQRSSDRYAFP